MPNQDDLNRAEPGIPHGTNADLLSASGTPIHSDMGSGPVDRMAMQGDSVLSSRDQFLHGDTRSKSSTGGLRQRMSGVADSGKSRLASGIHDLGDRIEHKGRELRSGNVFVRPVGRVLNSTGEALEDGANYLRRSGYGVIRDDIVTGIRHHPMLSAGIAVGCGWLLGQIMGGDEEEPEERQSRREEEDEEEQVEESSNSGFMGKVRGRVGDLVASGIASMAARQVRDRIAGR